MSFFSISLLDLNTISCQQNFEDESSGNLVGKLNHNYYFIKIGNDLCLINNTIPNQNEKQKNRAFKLSNLANIDKKFGKC